ncbi:MAG: aminodeoxychorismate synthase, component I [Anaerolineaceae bacterium]|nr:aminodeoxychorismate synthase, component I [Anaerolineaceae bacterium]
MQTGLSPAVVLKRSLAVRPAFEQLLARLAERRLPAVLDSCGPCGPLARFSIWAFDPFARLTHTGGRSTLIDSSGAAHRVADNPFEALRQQLARFRLPPAEEDVPLRAGAIGLLGYELGRYIERLPATVAPDISLPQMHWGFYDSVLVVDHRDGRATAWATDLGGRRPEELLDCWEALIDEAGQESLAPAAAQSVGARHAVPAEGRKARKLETALDQLACNFTPRAYRCAVARAIEYIAAGDIFQVNLSQRFTAPLLCEPAELYMRLRRANPAPFAAYIAADNWAVLSSSPERFLRVVDRRVETRPIKGTRPRRRVEPGQPPQEVESFNARSRAALLASEKEAAELAMIVDLERNDLGRVCDYGSVRVAEQRAVEPYAPSPRSRADCTSATTWSAC